VWGNVVQNSGSHLQSVGEQGSALPDGINPVEIFVQTPDANNSFGYEMLKCFVEALPPGTVVPVARDWLLGLLTVGQAGHVRHELAPPDLDVKQLAERYRRKESTVRQWCEEKRFPGAYKQRGKGWRVPPSGVVAFEEAERASGQAGQVEDLSGWRNITSKKKRSHGAT
jgi:hypothetical protein